MLALRSPLQAALKGHKKQSSTDSLNSQRKRKFLSVVSSETNILKPVQQLQQRKISELKKQAMGQITNRKEQLKGVTLKIKRASAQLTKEKSHEKGVGERMVNFKRRLINLVDFQDSLVSKENAQMGTRVTALQTPINRLLYQSGYKHTK